MGLPQRSLTIKVRSKRSNLPSTAGSTNSIMENSSSGRFSIGWPVRANLYGTLFPTFFKNFDLLAAWDLIIVASSMTIASIRMRSRYLESFCNNSALTTMYLQEIAALQSTSLALGVPSMTTALEVENLLISESH